MRHTRTLLILTTIAVWIFFGAFGGFQETEHVLASPSPTPLEYPFKILASETDGTAAANDCAVRPDDAIGCEATWNDYALDRNHVALIPTMVEENGKLLVFLCGGNGSAEPCENVFATAAERGYHVLAITYPNGLDACPEKLECFGDVLEETITGNDVTGYSQINDHDQDAVVNRLKSFLSYIIARQNPGDGWEQYISDGDIVWSKVNLAGFSNGSSHASFMGTHPDFQSIGRVALFAGPNDGEGNSNNWEPSHFIHRVEGMTDRRYYGLVHELNKATSYDDDDSVLFKVTKNWKQFGMGTPYNPDRFEFYPDMNLNSIDPRGAHMLISKDQPPPNPTVIPIPTDAGTTFQEAHFSVVQGRYCSAFVLDDNGTDYKCDDFFGDRIGYEPAWRCVLGSGAKYASTAPVSNAGPNQMVECEGSGGTTVELDGSGSSDVDCDILGYQWAGTFGSETGVNPSVFCPVGFNFISLVAFDEWKPSLFPSMTLVNVVDTTPPSLQMTLTPTVLWPADHRLVRIDATVTSSDSCGAAPVHVVLTSITNSQADNGLGDGDTDRDIQEASYETLDTSFYLRAERAGNVTAGRTYTVKYTATDASGNQTEATATVYVPHSQ